MSDSADLLSGSVPASASDGNQPMSTVEQRVFQVLNASTAPLWIAMIVAPRSKVTAWLMKIAAPIFVGLGVSYTALLVSGAVDADERINFMDPESLRRGLGSPKAFLAGWTHYLAFDLFVGRWIWQESVAAGRPARLSLLLTWWAGPLGLMLFLLRRAR